MLNLKAVRARFWWALASLATVGAGGLLLAGATVFADPSGPTLATVDAKTLARSGMVLKVPSGSPAVSKAAAEKAALGFRSATIVRETVLADHDNRHLNPPIVGRLVWVVSVDYPDGIRHISAGKPPADWPPGKGLPPLYGDYELVFVDAKTGQILYAHIGNLRPKRHGER